RAADGFILVPHITPGGLDEFVDRVVPELQERGVYRDAYPGTTLRENLGLASHRPEADWQSGRDAAAERDRAAARAEDGDTRAGGEARADADVPKEPVRV